MVTMRWDPFGEALSLRDAMSRLFEQAVLHPGGEMARSEGTGFAPALDVHESQDAYTIRASLPGVKPEDVDIQYQQGVLTISGSAQASTEQEGTYYVRERRWGRFSRAFSLPDGVDTDKAQASFENGVLELRLPKAEDTKPRRIPVRAGSNSSGQLETGAVTTAANGQNGAVKAGV